jgi:hypothetical protein
VRRGNWGQRRKREPKYRHHHTTEECVCLHPFDLGTVRPIRTDDSDIMLLPAGRAVTACASDRERRYVQRRGRPNHRRHLWATTRREGSTQEQEHGTVTQGMSQSLVRETGRSAGWRVIPLTAGA